MNRRTFVRGLLLAPLALAAIPTQKPALDMDALGQLVCDIKRARKSDGYDGFILMNNGAGNVSWCKPSHPSKEELRALFFNDDNTPKINHALFHES